jgi:LacI family transcriptional regulator
VADCDRSPAHFRRGEEEWKDAMGRGRVTLLDVAERAGVSRSTASFVLTGRSQELRISADARERVLQAAVELNYRPNLAARALRTKTTRTIGLISDSIATEQYAGEFIRGIAAATLKHDHLLVIGETAGNPEVEVRLVTGMLDRQVDGLIYGTMFTRQVRLPNSYRQHPLVLLNCLTARPPVAAVVPDEYQAGRSAVRALVDAGHRRGIHLVGERPRQLFAARERSRGIKDQLAEAGLRLAGGVSCAWSPGAAYEAVAELLADGRRPSAFVCLNDRVAMGVYQAVQQAGLAIPADVSVVSFDDTELAGWLRPQLASVALPHHEMGFLAAELLLSRELEPVRHRVPMPLRPRPSVAAPGG